MQTFRSGQPRLFEAFLKSAQYLVGLKSHLDVWDHLGHLIVAHLPAAWACFARRNSDREISILHSTLPPEAVALLAADETVEALVADVLDNGFLASKVIQVPMAAMTAALPVAENNQVKMVLLIGHHSIDPVPKKLLNIYLAVAGLAGASFDRLRNEEELIQYREQLEQLVKVRTAQLERAKLEAEEANRAKSIFLANMSHEIRTPMNGILGMTDLALMKIADPQVKEYLGYVKESGLHLLDIINDILDLSRIEAGKVTLSRESFSLKELLASTLEPFDSGFAIKNIGLTLNIDPDLPGRFIGDPNRLRQIFTNLIGNALKFTEKGHVRVAVGVGAPSPSPNRILLLGSVGDTGIGIPHQNLETIFNSFEQAHNSLHSKYGGSGLGLTICRNLAELMGGRMWVESREGVGSTFFFTALLDIEPAAKLEPETAAEPAVSVRPLKILVAEDNRVNQVFIQAMLKKEGHEVALAGTGRQALARLADNRYDLVLMDIRMPDMSGDEAVRVIRENPPPNVNPGIPVIALTAYALETERERFMECGFDAYLTKPVEIERLREILAELG